MSSINTNTSAMVALQTLKGINSNLAKTQSEISTGKSVASAKDNSAIWAISKVMESDVAGFESVSTNLATGQSMVSVARTATESIANDLKSIKQKVVAAQDPSADKEKLANEVTELVSMIQSKVSGAQFNGINLINNTDTQKIVGSLDRNAGVVTANTISVAGINLGSKPGTGAAEITAGTGLTASTDKKAAGGTVNDGATTDFTLASAAKDDVISLRVGDTEFSYTVSEADAESTKIDDVVVTNLLNQINNSGISGLTATYDGTAGKLVIDNGTGSNLNVTLSVAGKGDGDLAALSKFTGAAALADPTALADIEAMIKTTVDAAASFGAVESRLESQASFVDDLSAAMKSGIGSLVDADMEEASARLQALQTQQQLGIQALSIANQQPQSILSLFK